MEHQGMELSFRHLGARAVYPAAQCKRQEALELSRALEAVIQLKCSFKLSTRSSACEGS